jgi:hypothetical protein
VTAHVNMYGEPTRCICMAIDTRCTCGEQALPRFQLGRVDAIAAAERIGIQIVSFTCDDCPSAPSCEFAFDLYNTNGDCLAEK